MVVGVANPLLALSILHERVIVEPEEHVLAEAELDLPHVDVRDAFSLFALANQELTTSSEEHGAVLLRGRLEDVGHYAGL